MDLQTRISDLLRRNDEYIKRKIELDNQAAHMRSVLENKLRVFDGVAMYGDYRVRVECRGEEVVLRRHPSHATKPNDIISFGVKVDYAKGTVEHTQYVNGVVGYTHMGQKIDMNGVLELALEAVEKEFGGNS